MINVTGQIFRIFCVFVYIYDKGIREYQHEKVREKSMVGIADNVLYFISSERDEYTLILITTSGTCGYHSAG